MKTAFRCPSENRKNTLVYVVCLTPLALLDIETQNTGVNFGIYLPHLEYGEKNFFSMCRFTTVAIDSKTKMTKNIYAPHSNILWTLWFFPSWWSFRRVSYSSSQITHFLTYTGLSSVEVSSHFSSLAKKLLPLTLRMACLLAFLMKFFLCASTLKSICWPSFDLLLSM